MAALCQTTGPCISCDKLCQIVPHALPGSSYKDEMRPRRRTHDGKDWGGATVSAVQQAAKPMVDRCLTPSPASAVTMEDMRLFWTFSRWFLWYFLPCLCNSSDHGLTWPT